ncbi:hypothetical protein V495_00320 [Pseudogymnoascus sp. VKM F-4514 (FW-929)]|nr:hypothetical protein V495_00320 [Pseudogymnoascus sp. VKM F-4514 (FW-929)]
MKTLKLILALAWFSIVFCIDTMSLNVTAVVNVMIANAKSSWEFGTISEALLELNNPNLSVFGSAAFTPAPADIASLVYAKKHITLHEGLLINDASSNSDPASLGVAAAMLGITTAGYSTAAENQANTLLYHTPKALSGAISHRSQSIALWSDFVYMAPPFLAYYAILSQNASMLDIAVQQIQLYRDALKANTGGWSHISASSHPDSGLWSTGNGWAAMGIARTLASVQSSPFDVAIKSSQAALLKENVKEIIDAAMASPRGSSGLLHNYHQDATSIVEASGTALLAATTYRLAVIDPVMFGEVYVNWANSCLAAISAHVNVAGIVAPAVNPYDYRSQVPYTRGSPEGQAFTRGSNALYPVNHSTTIEISCSATAMHFTATAVMLGLLASFSTACFFTVHSSAVGDFKAQHSEPKDHGGAPQTITGGKGSCSFSGHLYDGCTVAVTSNNNCGSLSFTRIGNGKREETIEA